MKIGNIVDMVIKKIFKENWKYIWHGKAINIEHEICNIGKNIETRNIGKKHETSAKLDRRNADSGKF